MCNKYIMENNKVKEVYQKSEVCMLNIGLNYEGTDYELNGCIPDAIALNHAFRLILAIDDENVIMLRDDGYGNGTGSRENILNGLESIANKTKSMNNALTIITYSGHGLQSSTRDIKNIDESDGKDEMIIGNNNGTLEFITDNMVSDALEKINGRVVVLVDACNSGTIGDLPYKYIVEGNTKNNLPPNLKEVKENNRIMKNKNIIIIAAAQEDDLAYDVISNEQYRFGGEFTLEIINQLIKTSASAYINLIDIAIAIKKQHINAGLPNSVVISTPRPLEEMNTSISKMQIVKYVEEKTKSNAKDQTTQSGEENVDDSMKQIIHLTPKNMQKLAMFKKLKGKK